MIKGYDEEASPAPRLRTRAPAQNARKLKVKSIGLTGDPRVCDRIFSRSSYQTNYQTPESNHYPVLQLPIYMKEWISEPWIAMVFMWRHVRHTSWHKAKHVSSSVHHVTERFRLLWSPLYPLEYTGVTLLLRSSLAGSTNSKSCETHPGYDMLQQWINIPKSRKWWVGSEEGNPGYKIKGHVQASKHGASCT